MVAGAKPEPDWVTLPHVSIQEYETPEGWKVTFLQVTVAGRDVERWLVEVLPVTR